GTQLRGAMGYASVRLTLDNRDHTLDLAADEVIIGRSYYRSGESEYSINGQTCRLKDIYELFLDTGLGRDGYSIIGQGRIAEIVGAKSSERREIFEEASGIAKYRYRKNEAERRLNNAEENLARLRDILGELESRIGPLEKDSAKAQKFLELAASRKALEVTLWVDGVRRTKETVRDQQRKYETAEADYQRIDQMGRAAEAEAEEIREQAQRLTVEIDRLNGDIRSITEEMGGTESRIAVLRHDIQRNDQSIAQLEEELMQGEQSREQTAADIAAHRQAIAACEQQVQQLEAELAALEQQLAALQAEAEAAGQRRGQLAARLTELTGQQTTARVQAASAAAAAETAAQQLAAARNAGAAADDVLARMEEEQAETQNYLTKVQGDLARLNNMKNGLSLKLAGRQKALDEADAAELRIDRELEAAEQRLSVLREMEKNMEGYPHAVKAVMRAAQGRRLRGIIGPVSGILTVEKGYETAIETALGAALQNIVVENEAAAKAAIAFLRDERAGRATFLPLDTVQPGYFKGELTGTAQLASELVKYDARYDAIVSNLLGLIVVVDDINEASGVARRLGYRNRVVTVDGQVINAGGSFTGGSVQKSAVLFTRRQEIDELKQKLVKLHKQQTDAQDATDRAKAQVDSLNAQLTALNSEIITADGDRIRAETELRRIVAALQQGRASAESRAAEMEKLTAEIEAGRAAAQKAETEAARLTGDIDALSAELDRLTEGDDRFLALRAQISEEMGGKKLQQLASEKDAEAHRTAIETLQQRTAEHAGRKADVEQGINALRAQNEENLHSIAAIEAEREQSRLRIAEMEQQVQQARLQRMQRQQAETETNARARAAADEREKMSQEMARLAERKAAAETEYDQTIAKLWEEYQLSVTEAEKLCVPFETVTGLRAQVAEVRGKIRALGHVNVGAIEEFREVKERFDTLSAQVADVERSKNELMRMINELAGQMRQIFGENFKVINENFGRIFRELFGGGSASLALEEGADLLDAGIEIRVAPPGKVIKNLSALSGGEKALVAISIYFAILAVNPAPFCILDEIEAALDDANVVRYAQYLRRISDKTQFIVITHRRGTMEAADVLYGVTMQDDGVSKLLRLDLENVDASLVN
ncbi:MAG: chromosome segregation protein SMC, partial [Faecalibacterium sp.]|nr:chromosome segregation protein SMC [Faecalibacterium sp.]